MHNFTLLIYNIRSAVVGWFAGVVGCWAGGGGGSVCGGSACLRFLQVVLDGGFIGGSWGFGSKAAAGIYFGFWAAVFGLIGGRMLMGGFGSENEAAPGAEAKEGKDDAKDGKDVATAAAASGDVSAGKPVSPVFSGKPVSLVKDANDTNGVPITTEPEVLATAVTA
ncbi:hypothetical protein RHGRI_017729 [Rhododendron griersonianum]|uniref:Uncharacterized protein n=1 Tax=Rhododendron griersonianum TaxID=479676 RepID=A0AAV6JZ02_9ERIC|nr:hypothetical protein RHGRI_017729 [Rhododendron griersonianum]